jgi:hypothetical protein
MMIIGVDYHPSFQQVAFLMEETGEYGERQLNHGDGEAERFYRDLHERGSQVRVGLGYWILSLVRAAAGRTWFRAVDWRSRRDQGQASEEAEVRPQGCPTLTPTDARK